MRFKKKLATIEFTISPIVGCDYFKITDCDEYLGTLYWHTILLGCILITYRLIDTNKIL